MATWTRRNGFVNFHYMEHLKAVHQVHVHGMFYSKWSHYRIQSSTTVGSLLHFHSFSSKQCISRNAMKWFESSTLIYQRIHVLAFTKERTNYEGILRWFTHVLEGIYSVRRLIPLMVQKSGKHQLRLIAYPIIYHGFYTSQVVIAGFLKHQCFSTWLMSCASPRLPGGDFKYTCLMFIPKIGEDEPILTITFSDGLKRPTRLFSMFLITHVVHRFINIFVLCGPSTRLFSERFRTSTCLGRLSCFGCTEVMGVLSKTWRFGGLNPVIFSADDWDVLHHRNEMHMFFRFHETILRRWARIPRYVEIQ